jgi:hypothetical protein
MKPEEQNIAIAKILGYDFISGDHPFVTGLPRYWQPNYTGCLNAMHEAEKVLQQHMAKWWNYTSQLAAANSTLGAGGEAHATAKQRAEAFLRVFGKWEETE